MIFLDAVTSIYTPLLYLKKSNDKKMGCSHCIPLISFKELLSHQIHFSITALKIPVGIIAFCFVLFQ